MSILTELALAMLGGVIGYYIMRSAEREGYKHGYQDGLHDRKEHSKPKRTKRDEQATAIP